MAKTATRHRTVRERGAKADMRIRDNASYPGETWWQGRRRHAVSLLLRRHLVEGSTGARAPRRRLAAAHPSLAALQRHHPAARRRLQAQGGTCDEEGPELGAGRRPVAHTQRAVTTYKDWAESSASSRDDGREHPPPRLWNPGTLARRRAARTTRSLRLAIWFCTVAACYRNQRQIDQGRRSSKCVVKSPFFSSRQV
jgi:hypothetical protein